MDRPGGVHEWVQLYGEDHFLFDQWGFRGTPAFALLRPDRSIAWSSLDSGQESIIDAMDRLVPAA